MRFMSKQVSLPKISSILQKNENRPKNQYTPFFAWRPSIGKKKPEKNQGFNRIWTCDLRDTGVMLYQLSYMYEATHWKRGESIEFISPVRSEMMWSI